METEMLTETSLVDVITSTATHEITKKIVPQLELSTQEASFSTEASSEHLKSIEETTAEEIPHLVTTNLFAPTTVPEYSSISMESSESSSQPSEATVEDVSYEYSTEGDLTSTVLDTTTRPSVIKLTKKKVDTTKGIATPVWEKSIEDTMTIISTSEQPEEKTDYLDRMSTVSPSEISEQYITTAKKPLLIESVEEPGESDKILDKLSKISSENVTEVVSIGSTTVRSSESIESIPSASIDVSTTELQETKEIPSVESEEKNEIRKTTIPRVSTEELVPVISTSMVSDIKTTTSPDNEYDYMCTDSEDCVSVSTSESCEDSEDCSSPKESCEESGTCEEQSTEDKSGTSSTTKIQTPVIDLQSSEMSVSEVSEMEPQLSSTTVATLISEEVSDNASMAISNVPTTVETRRSTPLSTTSVPRHKLILKIKVLLEHVNEKEEKEKLVEVEKQLSLDENPEHHRDPNFLKQLKSSNESISMEAVSALLNCTSLGNLTNVAFMNKRPNDDVNSDIDINSRYESHYADAYSADPILEQSATSSEQVTYEEQYPDFDEEYETRKRKRRGFAGNREDIFLNAFKKNSFVPLSSDFINPTGTLNVDSMRENTRLRNKFEKRTGNAARSNEIRSMEIKKANNERRKMEIVRRALPEVAKDLSVGLRDVMSQLTRHDLISANGSKKKVDKMNVLDIIADPKDNRFHSRRKRAATEEIGRWSNERIRKMPTGGNLRSFTEFVLYDILS